MGVAGLGFGQAVLIPAFNTTPHAQVTAIAGRRVAKTREVARNLGVPAACETLDELLDQPLDAVAFALPPQLNAEAVAKALARGFAVLVEKPLAPDAATAATLAKRAVGRTAGMDFEFAELRSFQALRDLVRSGELGWIDRIGVEWITLSYAQRRHAWSWKSDAAQGGGVLTLFGAHVFYLLEWLLGPVRPTGARLSNAATMSFAPAGGMAAEDCAELNLISDAGTEIRVNLSSSSAKPPLHRWTVVGAAGTAVLENLQISTVSGFRLIQRPPDGCPIELAREETVEGDDRIGPCRNLIGRFVVAARRGAAVAPDLGTGARVQTLIDESRRLARP